MLCHFGHSERAFVVAVLFKNMTALPFKMGITKYKESISSYYILKGKMECILNR